MMNDEFVSQSPSSVNRRKAGTSASAFASSTLAFFKTDGLKDQIHRSLFITHPSSFLLLGRRRSLGLLLLHGLEALVGIGL